ncbi:ABC transporter permease [Dehalogenimonas alkenigignens]|uniref:ABC transporter permease n=1 Tax=Dehalogenimonas alkenigignens TaxID=1217799 RepID=UPI000D567FD4|nr:ABC transporter permease [Dehalogenimonas alkenigignens]PVV83718.1 ABC transporter permease [Dehalogenimonas alkenigignens]
MNPRTIKALLKKDIALFTGNRFYLLITVLGLIFYIAIYLILPSKVDEKLSLGMYAPVVPPAFEQLTAQGAEIEFFETEAALKQAVLDGGHQVGVSLPADIMEVWNAGGKPGITVYYSATAPPEIAEAIVTLIKELSYIQTGQALQFDTTEEILGPDLLGAQIALRDRMRPMLAVLILLTEVMTLAALIAVEIEQGTARALLVTPMRTSDLFAAKGILGVGLALGQAVIFMGLVGGFSHQPLLILATLIIASIFVVGAGFLLASLARDTNAVTGWGIMVLILLAVPGFGAVVPGLLADWAKVIPSYYLIDTVNRVVNYGAGWSDAAGNLLVMSGISAVLLGAGLLVLRRRFQ